MYSPSTYIPVHVKQYQRKILMDEMLPASFPARGTGSKMCIKMIKSGAVLQKSRVYYRIRTK